MMALSPNIRSQQQIVTLIRSRWQPVGEEIPIAASCGLGHISAPVTTKCSPLRQTARKEKELQKKSQLAGEAYNAVYSFFRQIV